MDNNQLYNQDNSLQTQSSMTEQNAYAGQESYAGQNAYAGQESYAGQNAYTGQNPYAGQNPYTGQNPHAGGQYTYNSQWMQGGSANAGSQYNQPYNPYYANMAYSYPGMPMQPQGNGMMGISIAGMVLGILSIICCFLTLLNFILVIPGLVLSIIAVVKQYDGKGMAIAGIICSSLGGILSIVYFIVVAFAMYA